MARNVFGKPGIKLDETTEPQPPLPRRQPLAKGGAGAPRYMQGSVDAVGDRSHEDIPVSQIQGSLIEDRIDLTEDIESLMESIETNGQQIPIIVRIVNKDQPYEIVAGRRRLEAMRRLGRATIRGFVTRMSDEEAFVAQGIENSARLETSFIERARTAVMALEAGFSQTRVAEFLATKQSMVSMMMSVYTKVGEDLVKAIGPARGVGRRKWEKLSRLLDEKGLDGSEAVRLIDASIAVSSERFEDLSERLAGPSTVLPETPAPTPPAPLATNLSKNRKRRRHLGGRITTIQAPGRLTIKAGDEGLDGFLEYISDRLDDLRESFEQQEEDTMKS